ncbi:MAG: triose-phosphate isomerase [Tissierellia bacterium]|nr:triose-phosphate isomerase [Tissierellia bacterium]
MRKPLIAGNWKMNFTLSEAVDFTRALVEQKYNADVEKAICVPATHLSELRKLTENSGIGLGAQNMYYEEKGAFTGEVSPLMLNDIGVEYVIIGHSERREIFCEDDDLVNNKVLSAIAHELKPILCCGETLEEREAGKAEEKVKGQIHEGLKGVTPEQIQGVVIAYEPIWAIGTGKTASSEDANDMCGIIRKTVEEIYDGAAAEGIRILYGGSVKPSNISELMAKSDIDGALVGGASLEVKSFGELVNY